MILPHWFVHAPWEEKITGHDGVTYLLWTFVNLERPPRPTFVRHEDRHVQQSCGITIVTLALLAAVVRFAHLTPWLVTLALLAWPVAYWLVSIVWKIRTGQGYTDNYFERDARRYAARKP